MNYALNLRTGVVQDANNSDSNRYCSANPRTWICFVSHLETRPESSPEIFPADERQ